jgi:hypothetical protein
MHAGHGAIKLHTVLDIRGAIPTVIHFSEGRQHDVHLLDEIVPEPGAIYIIPAIASRSPTRNSSSG